MHILFSFGAPFRVALIMVYAATFMAAHAGAWVPRKGEGKLILNQIEQRQDEANVVRFRHKEIYQSLLLEYGLSETIGIAAKRGVQKRFLPQGNSRTDETRFGITFNAPAIATGLLPPYFFGLAKKMLPLKNIQREKRASMTLGWLDDETQYWSALAQGDRISVGRLRVTQEVSFDRLRGKGRDWRNWLYRFTFGFADIDIGTEAHRFIDYNGTYQALSHSYYVQWKPSGYRLENWQMRLKSGTRRAPLGGLTIQKNDTLTLEFEMAF